MKGLLLIGLLNCVNNGSFVFEICFTLDRENQDISLKQETRNKENANFCVTDVQDCNKSGVMMIYYDPEAKESFYMSHSSTTCK